MHFAVAADVVSSSLAKGLAAPAQVRRLTDVGALPAHQQAAQLFSLFERFLDGRRVTYVSVPLTSGLRAAHWALQLPASFDANSPGYAARYEAEVFAPNRLSARAAVQRLAQANPKVMFLDPSLLDVPGWSQADYLSFWISIVDRLTDRVVLTKGWNYSAGCSFEACAALRHGVPCRDEDNAPVETSDAITHIRRGIAELDAMGADVGRLASTVRDLEGFAN